MIASYIALSVSRSAARTHSSTLWMVALQGPSSITWQPSGAMKRPSEVPPLVGRQPSYAITGRSTRFDVYPLRRYD